MGIKAWFKQAREDAQWFASYDVHSVNKGIYKYLPKGQFKSVSKPVAGASAEFDKGGENSSATIGRVAAGAIIAGPVGAIVGGMFKKQKGRVYVYVTFPDGEVVVVDGPMKDESQLRKFALDVDKAARHYADQ